MSSWSYALTNKGRQLQAKAQAGAQLVYTRMAIGRGSLSGQSLDGMTALISPVKDLIISRIKRPTGSTRATIGATLTNQDDTTGFHLREIGVFATDPNDGEILYMYANAGATADYIAPKGDGMIEKRLNFNVFVGSAANITANIDESLVYVTKQELDDALEGITIEEASTAQKGIVQLSSTINSTSETMAATPKAIKTAYDAATAAQATANAANAAVVEAQSKADQAFQSGNERKQEVVDLLVAKGITASTTDSWGTLLDKLSKMSFKFKVSNLIKNGSFENELNCWSAQYFTATTTTMPDTFGNKVLSAKLLASSAEGLLSQPLKYISGHQYYACGYISSTKNVTLDIYFPLIAPQYPSAQAIPITGDNTFHFFSGMITKTSEIASQTADFRLDFNNSWTSMDAWLDGVMLLDLTEAFGAGNVPSKEVMDLIVQANGGWWDSDLQVLTSDATVLASQILSGVTAYKNGMKVTGAMLARAGNYQGEMPASASPTPGVIDVKPQIGFWDGNTWGGIMDSDFVAGNIRSGVNIFGLIGSLREMKIATGEVSTGSSGVLTTGKSVIPFEPKLVFIRKFVNSMPGDRIISMALFITAGFFSPLSGITSMPFETNIRIKNTTSPAPTWDIDYSGSVGTLSDGVGNYGIRCSGLVEDSLHFWCALG